MHYGPFGAGAVSETDIAKRLRYKRVLDLAIIGIAFLLFLPLWILLLLIIALAIWIEDRGQIFYVQSRAGMHGRRFSILKFRTLQPGSGNSLVAPRDARLTIVGAWLRRLYLDELPQIVNVVAGHMSLVGPRPEWWDRHLEICRQLPEFHQRLRVPPGIAGLAQVRGSYWSSAKEKLRYDNLYIDTFGPWLDVKLLALAVHTAFKRWLKPDEPKGHEANGSRLTPSPLPPPDPKGLSSDRSAKGRPLVRRRPNRR